MAATREPGEKERSLAQLHPRRWDLPLLILVDFVLLAFALALPIVSFSKAAYLDNDRYSVVSGIVGLFRSGNLFIGTLVFTFSILFPLFKLSSLAVLWFRRLTPRRRLAMVRMLQVLGKWSMLDVFVVAVLAVLVRLGLAVQARLESGIYVFATAILLSMILTFIMYGMAHRRVDAGADRVEGSPLILPLAVIALFCIGAGLELPLMEASKGWFWEEEFSVLEGTLELHRRGRVWVALMLGIFVVLLPLLHASGLIALQIQSLLGKSHTSFHRFLDKLEEWSMYDVFALAILIVVVKIGGLVAISPRPGLWFLAAGSILSVLLSWVQRTKIFRHSSA